MISLLLGLLVALSPQRYQTTTFHFARLQYSGAPDTSIKNWYTDYPEMDDHTVALINRLTQIKAAKMKVKPSHAALHMFPFLYVVEPEQMVLDKAEISNLRTWFKRGGFMWMDDFHGDTEFETALSTLRQILPDAQPVELTVEHPLFHVFFDIRKIERVVTDSLIFCRDLGCEQWENGISGKDPKVFAVFDKGGNIQVIMSFNNDVADGLEFIDWPEYPREMSSYAVRFVLNVVIWSMSH